MKADVFSRKFRQLFERALIKNPTSGKKSIASRIAREFRLNQKEAMEALSDIEISQFADEKDLWKPKRRKH